MNKAVVSTLAALLLCMVPPDSRAASPPLRVAYLSGNAGEIDPCG